MEFGVLGPVEVRTAGGPVHPGVRKQRLVLAVLLLEAGRLVPVDRLISLLWPDEPPRSARAVVHTQISRLRSVLATAGAARAGVALISDGPGYLLRCDPDRVDAHRFRALCAAARGQDDERRVATLKEALALWRGPALAGLEVPALGHDLEQARLAAWEERFDAEARLGRHREVVAELTALVAAHPHHESLVGRLMVALDRCGRRGEALHAYGELHRRLDRELGVRPSARLRRIHAQLLGAAPERSAPLPRQLPPDVTPFVGRADALAALDRLAGPRPVVVSAVTGVPGVGKTSLAVHWAHRARERFPDGQLYVDLRGYDPGGSALDPADVLGTFLRSLGVAAADVPAEVHARAALYRSLLADKAVLVVLDNARDAAQVRPLLPASPSSAVVVTSRDALSGLVVRSGAVRVPLAALSPDESLGLVRSVLGDRVAREPDAVARLCRLCGHLPLALRIAAELVSLRSGEAIADLVAELRDDRARLSLLSTSDGDEHTAMRAVFDWSYRALPGEARRAFRLLAVHRGPDLGLDAAGALLDVPDPRPVLDTLVHANLVERADGRYRFHDLLRLFAADQPVAPDERRAAARRLLRWYLGAAGRADRALAPGRQAVPDEHPVDGPAFATQRAALAWFDAERENLVAAVRHAADEGVGAWRLAAVTGEYLYVRRLWGDWEATHVVALRAAERAGDATGVAWMSSNLGVLALERHRVDEAVRHLERGLDLVADVPGPVGQHLRGLLGTTLGHALRRRGEFARSLACHSASLDIHRATGNAWGEGETLINLATTRAAQGDHAAAVALLAEAVEVERRLGNWCRVGSALARLAHARHVAGDPAGAAGTFREAADLLLESGDRWAAAWCLVHREDARLALGAAARWGDAEALFGDGTGRLGVADPPGSRHAVVPATDASDLVTE
ncbi:AfsR/SARP family transcriptional regulator [Saccharothrix variisporea]|uniref:DNA-binding SARP family transcriptional activator n=1 Tax=Saccharothrix variisporea TaxID=543527 RepID=A0A495X6N0_9PSEU|nr:BTAD domain-containing putative transcriptional regulator [Saccharothrix variisporea]RKT69206.1 DNA-binding SARP family transcriptional activator [Saccharothrix variisporea]